MWGEGWVVGRLGKLLRVVPDHVRVHTCRVRAPPARPPFPDLRPVGLTAMHITVGEVDMERFQKQQEENVLLKRRVYQRLDVDLSAPLPPDAMEESMRIMKQRKLDDFMATGLGRVGAQNAVEKWLLGRAPSRAKRYVYLWYEKKPSTCGTWGVCGWMCMCVCVCVCVCARAHDSGLLGCV